MVVVLRIDRRCVVCARRVLWYVRNNDCVGTELNVERRRPVKLQCIRRIQRSWTPSTLQDIANIGGPEGLLRQRVVVRFYGSYLAHFWILLVLHGGRQPKGPLVPVALLTRYYVVSLLIIQGQVLII